VYDVDQTGLKEDTLGDAMNGKIPVFGAVGSAYGFAFGRFLTVLRLSWFWLAVVIGLNVYWGPAIMEATVQGLKAFESGGQEAMAAAMSGVQFESNVLQLVQSLAGLFILVALVRAVVSQDYRDGVPVHIISGMSDLRVLGVSILLMIAIIAGAIGIGIVFGILAAVLTQAGAGAVVGILAIVLGLFLIWVFLRLSLVLPVAAVESNLGVERSWSLMKGNSLRMLIALLLTFIPFGIGVSFAFSAILGPEIFQGFPQPDQANPQAFQGAIMAWFGALVEKMAANWPVFMGFSALVTMISYGLWAGLLGRAYRAAANMDGE
jgi:hypothetical protein